MLAHGDFGRPHQCHTSGKEDTVKGNDPPANVGFVKFRAMSGASAGVFAATTGVLAGAMIDRNILAPMGTVDNGA